MSVSCGEVLDILIIKRSHSLLNDTLTLHCISRQRFRLQSMNEGTRDEYDQLNRRAYVHATGWGEASLRITYEFSFIVDYFDDIALLSRGDDAGAELFTEYLHLFPTSLGGRVDCIGRASVRLYGRALEELLERTEDPGVLIVRAERLAIVIFRAQNLHLVVAREYLRRRLAKLVAEKLCKIPPLTVRYFTRAIDIKVNFVYELWYSDARRRAYSCPIGQTVSTRYRSRRRTWRTVSFSNRTPNGDLRRERHRGCLDPPRSSGRSSSMAVSRSTATMADGSSLIETITRSAS